MVGHLRWEWAWAVRIASAPPCAMTPTQQISYFRFVSALIANDVCRVRCGAGRLSGLLATGSAAPSAASSFGALPN